MKAAVAAAAEDPPRQQAPQQSNTHTQQRLYKAAEERKRKRGEKRHRDIEEDDTDAEALKTIAADCCVCFASFAHALTLLRAAMAQACPSLRDRAQRSDVVDDLSPPLPYSSICRATSEL